MSNGNPTLCAAILARFRAAGALHDVLEHAPLSGAGSAADAVRLRGTPLRMGGKALLLKADGNYLVAAFSASRRLHSNTLRKALGVRRMRFASREELLDATGLVPGCVPPFGRPLLPFPLFADPSLLENDAIAFTPGLLTCSVVTPAEVWQELAQPTVLHFTVEGRS